MSALWEINDKVFVVGYGFGYYAGRSLRGSFVEFCDGRLIADIPSDMMEAA